MFIILHFEFCTVFAMNHCIFWLTAEHTDYLIFALEFDYILPENVNIFSAT